MEWCLDASRFLYTFLSLDYSEAVKLVENLPETYASFEDYIRNTVLPLVVKNIKM